MTKYEQDIYIHIIFSTHIFFRGNNIYYPGKSA
jgi:hypothetical protein